MTKKTKNSIFIFIMLLLFSIDTLALVSPMRRGKDNALLLTNCDEIKLISQVIDLYHHPLGIWLVTCTSKFQNLHPQTIVQEMGCNTGFDINMFDGKMYSDEFYNFHVYEGGQRLKNVHLQERCENYVDRIGLEWTNDDNSGIGFVNTWTVEFEPQQIKTIKIEFCFIIKKPSIKFDPALKEVWYTEATNWLKDEYTKQSENHFKLPLNMGSFWILNIDTLQIKTYYSNQWLGIEEEKKRNYELGNIQLYTYSEPVGFFSPPAFELQKITAQDLDGKSKTELKLLRNSFFAKYGRCFNEKWLKLYFSKQPWYQENPGYDNWYLTELDIENMKFIHQFEKNGKSND